MSTIEWGLVGALLFGTGAIAWLVGTLQRMRLQLEDCSKKEQSLENRLREASEELASVLGEKKVLEIRLDEREKAREATHQINETITKEFTRVASETLRNENKQLQHQSQTLLAPLGKELSEFRMRIEDLQREQIRERTALKAEIQSLTKVNQSTTESANRLANALSYDNKKQGDWGEWKLEMLLQNSGLKAGREYTVQQSARNNEGRLMRPDVVLHLPDGKDVIIDSKVSLVDYQRYIDDKNEAHLDAHLVSMERHVEEVSKKSYQDLLGINGLDFIFVFFPIESALLLAQERKPEVFANAMGKNVALVSPSTLMTSLRMVNYLWRKEKQQRNVEEIMREVGAMYDKLCGFVEALDSVGKYLDKTQVQYKLVRKRLETGEKNLIERAKKLKDMGIESRKLLK